MNEQLILPSAKYKQKLGYMGISLFVVVAVCIYLKYNPFLIFADFTPIQRLLGEMLPPNFSLLWQPIIGKAIAQTASMAFLATFYGCLIAFILAFLTAANTMPLRFIRLLVGGFLSLLRIIPPLVCILIFIIAVGLGAFSGMLALIVITVGMFGRLFTDIIENTEHSAADAIYSVGASRLQVIRYAILPQIIPSFIANCLYAFDVNIRVAISLGIFGGGGIGYELYMAMQVLHYQDAFALICLIIIMIVLIEKASDYFRVMILGKEKLR
jgi:phosphonate transport system permease protein